MFRNNFPYREVLIPYRYYPKHLKLVCKDVKVCITLWLGVSPFIPGIQRSTPTAFQPHLPCLSPAGCLLDYTCCTEWWFQTDKYNKVLLMLHLTFSLNWLISLCLIRFVPSGLRTRPEHKCPTIQRTLPHLKGWNLLNLIVWTEPAIFGLQWTSILMGRLLVSVPSLFQ